MSEGLFKQKKKKRPCLKIWKLQKEKSHCQRSIHGKSSRSTTLKLVRRLKDKSSKVICNYNKELRDTQKKRVQNMISKAVTVTRGIKTKDWSDWFCCKVAFIATI